MTWNVKWILWSFSYRAVYSNGTSSSWKHFTALREPFAWSMVKLHSNLFFGEGQMQPSPTAYLQNPRVLLHSINSLTSRYSSASTAPSRIRYHKFFETSHYGSQFKCVFMSLSHWNNGWTNKQTSALMYIVKWAWTKTYF